MLLLPVIVTDTAIGSIFNHPSVTTYDTLSKEVLVVVKLSGVNPILYVFTSVPFAYAATPSFSFTSEGVNPLPLYG